MSEAEKQVPVTEVDLDELDHLSAMVIHSFAASCLFWGIALVTAIMGVLYRDYVIAAAAVTGAVTGTFALWLNAFYRRSLKALIKDIRERSSL